METQEWMNDSFTPIHKFNRSFTTSIPRQGPLLGARGKWVNIDWLPDRLSWAALSALALQSSDSGARLPRFFSQLCHLLVG